MKMIKTLALTLALAGMSAMTAQAAQINGFISFTSGGSVWTGNTANVNTITTITSFGNTTVDARFGDFTAVAAGASVTMGVPLNFVTPTIVNPFWSVAPFSFTLNSITSITRDDNPGSLDTLSLSGLGTITAAGFDPTPGEWVWSGDLNGTNFFTFSSTTVATPGVPDGGSTLVLLGMGMVSLFAFGRKSLRA